VFVNYCVNFYVLSRPVLRSDGESFYNTAQLQRRLDYFRLSRVCLSVFTELCMFLSKLNDDDQGRTGPPTSLPLARWAGWSAGQVGRHVNDIPLKGKG